MVLNLGVPRNRGRLAQTAGIVEIDPDGILGLRIGVIADHVPVHHAVEQRHDVIRLEVQARHRLGCRVLREGFNNRQRVGGESGCRRIPENKLAAIRRCRVGGALRQHDSGAGREDRLLDQDRIPIRRYRKTVDPVRGQHDTARRRGGNFRLQSRIARRQSENRHVDIGLRIDRRTESGHTGIEQFAQIRRTNIERPGRTQADIVIDLAGAGPSSRSRPGPRSNSW